MATASGRPISRTLFSDDLDFTSLSPVDAASFQGPLQRLAQVAGSAAGIDFALDKTRVADAAIADTDLRAIDARIYFRGFAGDASLLLRIKFDVSPFERIVLPTPVRPVLHPFSDAPACVCSVKTYALEEVLAEKLRSWIQRTRARDLYDVVKILRSERADVSKRTILGTFLQKTIFKGIEPVAKAELLEPTKFNTVEQDWLRTLVCPINALIVFSNAVALFSQFVNALFAPETVSAMRRTAAPLAVYGRRIASSIREVISAAGRHRHLLGITYKGIARTVEPYSVQYKVRKSDGRGFEYFNAYDRTRGPSMKSF